ncbi:MAG: F0F1 ATP synthase subunit B' [Alphaproteobacteria bacterium]|nr:F0F1 ATP synthase subunit B' [Alphaproteobacteria bacterium]
MPQLEFWHFLPQFFWLAVCFVFLYVIMAFVALPRIGRVLTDRQHRIEQDLDGAEKARADAERARLEYEGSLEEARGRAREAVQQAAEDGNRSLEALDRETGRELEDAQRSIDEARAAALANLEGVAVEAARLATRRLTGADVSDEDALEALAAVRGN